MRSGKVLVDVLFFCVAFMRLFVLLDPLVKPEDDNYDTVWLVGMTFTHFMNIPTKHAIELYKDSH